MEQAVVESWAQRYGLIETGTGAGAPAGEPSGAASRDTVRRALRLVRAHLGMEVAYVSEILGNESHYREVDAPGLEGLIKIGDSRSLDDVYCRHILEGRLPELIPDTAAEPLAAAMPITAAVPIGAHASVPIRLSDGRVYGMFCCLGFGADRSLSQRDLQMMRAFAEFTAFEIERDVTAAEALRRKRDRIQAVIEEGGLAIVFQPIKESLTGRTVGVEALSRFSSDPPRTPDIWFAEAADVGLGAALELAAVERALEAIIQLPGELYLSINVSPDAICSGGLPDLVRGRPLDRIVLELTEHSAIADYERLEGCLQPLRASGIRLAVDDAGAGFSSLQHILRLRPDFIKLDKTLTQGIDRDPVRRALAAALGRFALEAGGRIIAEGVEEASELAALQALGVTLAQGYFLGRPMPLDQVVALAGAAP